MKTFFHTIVMLGVLVISTPASAAEDPEQFVDLMSKYLNLTNQVVDIASRPEATAFLAIEGIFEIYEERRDVPGAIRHLEQIIDKYGNDQTIRNLARLKLRDVYKESGQADKALAQLDLMIKGNAR